MPKRKVLLLNPPADKRVFRDNYCSFTSTAGYYWPPIDLLVLSGILSAEYSVQIIDAVAENLSHFTCIERVEADMYAGIFVLCGTASVTQDLLFARLCKEKTQSPIIVLGGLFLTEDKKYIDKFPFIEAVLLDYTEKDIVRYLVGERDSLYGISYRSKEGLVKRGMIRVNEFSYPIPLHARFPIPNYSIPTLRNEPFTTILTSFGCPFACRFCVASIMPYKKRAMESIEEEFTYLQAQGYKELFFVDSTFSADPLHVDDVCKVILRNKYTFGWCCNVHASNVNRELLLKMKKAGCHTVMLGVESGSDEILDRYRKNISTDLIREAFSMMRSVGLRIGAYFIIGLPGDTVETINQTIEFACELDPDFASFAYAAPDIGTDLWRESVSEKWFQSSIESFDAQSHPLIEIPHIHNDMVQKLYRKAYRAFYFRPSYILKRFRGVKTKKEWQDLVRYGVALFSLQCKKEKRKRR